MRITELLADAQYVSALLNGPCRPVETDAEFRPVEPVWIDKETSAEVTAAFRRLLPNGIPYLTYIYAEKNPDTIYDGACVNDNEKRMRYFLITLIPDTEYPFNCSFPLIHQMWTFSLHCWEIIRAALAACEKDMLVRIANEPVPPILNNAVIHWVSIYLGRKPFDGLLRLSQQWADPAEYDGKERDIHMYFPREMEYDDLLQKLMDAYDEEYPVNGNRNNHLR